MAPLKAFLRQSWAHLWFFDDLDAVHVVLHGVDDDENISKLSRNDASPVVPWMLGPHDVHFIVTQVS